MEKDRSDVRQDKGNSGPDKNIAGCCVDNTAARVQDATKDILEAIQKVARGDLSAQIKITDKNDEFDSLSMGINMMIDDIRAAMEKEEALAEELRTVNEKLISVNEEIESLNEQLETIIDSSPSMVFYKDKDNRFIRVNEALARANNKSKQEMEGKTCWELYPKKEADHYWQDDKDVMAEGSPKLNIIESMETPRGTVWVRTDKMPYRDRKGEIIGIIGFALDITESKKAEKELRESEERLKVLFEFAPDAYFISDLKGILIDGNRAAEELVGFKKEELIGKNFLDIGLLSPDKIPFAAKLLALNLLGKPTGPDEFILNRKDGARVEVEISTYPVTIKGEKLVLGIAHNITERKKIEQSQNIFAEITKNMTEGIYLIGVKDGIIRWTNPKLEMMFGYGPGEMTGRNVSIVNNPSDSDPQETARKIISELNDTGEWHGEVHNIKKDGTSFWCYANCSIFDHPEFGRVIMAVHTDITERKKAEEALKEAKLFNEASMNAMQDIFYVFDTDSRALLWNRSFREISSYSDEEIAQMKPDRYFSNEDAKRVRSAIEQIYVRGYSSVEADFITKEGKSIPYEFTGSILKNKEGKVVGFSGIGRDLSERKRSEDALKNSEKLLRETGKIAKVGGWVLDLETEKQVWTDEVYEIHEVGKDFVPTLSNGINFYAPEAKPAITAAVRNAIEKNEPFDVELPFITAKNNRIWVRAIGKADFKDGKAIKLWGTFQDISERRIAEEKLRNAAIEWENTFNSISDFVFIEDTDYRFVKVNKAFCDAFKIKPDDLIGKKCYEVVHRTDKPCPICPLTKTYTDKKPHTEEVDDENIGIPLLVSTCPILDEKGGLVGAVHIAKDISERLKIESELKSKIESLEKFQKVTVDRELKMKELKAKIEELESQINK